MDDLLIRNATLLDGSGAEPVNGDVAVRNGRIRAIGASLPVDATQEPEGHVSIDPAALGVRSGATLFALRVRGDSMVDAGILDRDTVFLTPRDPRPGAIVAALIDGESTLKRFLVQRGRPFLRAENPRYPDLLPATELIIQGVMVGLLRQQPAA